MNELKKALAFADENFLVSLSNKGTYKRALKDIEGEKADFETGDNSATVRTGGEVCTVKVPLAESKCTCISRGICRHLISAIVILKNNIPIDCENIQPEKEVQPLQPVAEEKPQQPEKEKEENIPEKDIEKIHACAESCMAVLEDIARYGLVRIPENIPDMLETSAVRCHSLRMAEAERVLRSLGGKLSDCIERRASFSMDFFINDLCNCISVIESLKGDFIQPSQLGTFRKTYTEYKGNLDILPIGMRNIKGNEYEGSIYYFLNMDSYAEYRFMSLSDLRPVFYDDMRKNFRKGGNIIWGAISSMKEMMHSEMKLAYAKVSGGSLSTSQETQIISAVKAVHDCDEIRELIYTDFRKLAVEISEKNPDSELERLCFVQPEKCTESGFDKYTQQYIMTLEDVNHSHISVKARYRAESKDFIELLENIGNKMLKNPKKNYVFLATAYIENGELTLFPIEIYDFIRPPESDTYELPERYSDIDTKALYAEKTENLFSEIDEKLCVIIRSGLQADIKNDRRLENLAFNYGLKGLSGLLAEFMESASAYRHSTDTDCTDILKKMLAVKKYVIQGRKRLETITSLYNMKGSR